MTKIEWTDDTWNPVVGCTKVSTGCDNCYAERMALRQAGMEYARYNENANCEYPQPFEGGKYSDVVNTSKRCWNGETFCDEKALEIPLHWKKPKLIFVCSMSDLFHPSVPFEFIDKVFAVMALCPQHTFQVLTKRPERMAEYLTYSKRSLKIMDAARQIAKGRGGEFMNDAGVICWPLPNVWLGATAENQNTLDKRFEDLLLLSAAGWRIFLSCEPLLSHLYLTHFNTEMWWCPSCEQFSKYPDEYEELPEGYDEEDEQGICPHCGHSSANHFLAYHQYEYFMESDKEIAIESNLDWVICGGESGAGARPMHPDWARSLRDQCDTAGVPFLFKQWGAWVGSNCNSFTDETVKTISRGCKVHNWPNGNQSFRVGKKKAGRLLDGVEHNEYPKRGG